MPRATVRSIWSAARSARSPSSTSRMRSTRCRSSTSTASPRRESPRFAPCCATGRSRRSRRSRACRPRACRHCPPPPLCSTRWSGCSDPSASSYRRSACAKGILYRDLDEPTRAQDPLLAGALEVGERLGRFGDHGAALDEWIAPLFPDDSPGAARLRLAACLLADIAWNAHPDFRAERAVDMAIHGNWVGIDASGRALLGRALCSAFGGDGGFDKSLTALLKPAENERAMVWGKAIRLGPALQRRHRDLAAQEQHRPDPPSRSC